MGKCDACGAFEFLAMKNLHLVSHLQHSRVSLVVLVVFLLGGQVRVALAEVRLPAIISGHMVLQAECPV